jgi:hypothetical protein
MTWHTNISSTPSTSLQEQEAAFSLTSYLDTIRLERAKSNPTQEMSSSPDNETDILPAFPIWDDVCTLDGTPGAEQLTFFAEDSPVRTSVRHVKEQELMGERRALDRICGSLEKCGLVFVFAENSPLRLGDLEFPRDLPTGV